MTIVTVPMTEQSPSPTPSAAGASAPAPSVAAVPAFILRLAEELDLSGLWGFEHSNTCSRPRLDAFGGGAHVIDLGARKVIGWVNTQTWMAAALNGEDPDA